MQSRTFKSQFTTNFEFSQAKTSSADKNRPNMTVIYTHGLYSDPWGRKPETIKSFCLENGLDFFRFELAGHGSDTLSYEDVDFNVWKEQLLEIIDEMVTGKILLVGSSLGGWLSLIAARERPERVAGVVGLAPAPDFTLDLEKYVFTPEQKADLANGRLVFPMKDFSYVFTKKIFDTARDNLLLEAPLNVSCPVHILHGTEDKNLDPQKPFKLQKCLTSEVVIVKLIKGANHRLGRDEDLKEIIASLKSFF